MAKLRKVRYTAVALEQRRRILEYWIERLNDKAFARRLFDGFVSSVRLISQFPDAGIILEEYPHLRSFTYKQYSIVYEQHADRTIIIHQFWDTRQNPANFTLH